MISCLESLIETKKSLDRESNKWGISTESGVVGVEETSALLSNEAVNENFMDADGLETKEVDAGESFSPEQGQESFLDMGDYLARPVEIYKGSFALAATPSLQLSVWDEWSTQPSVRAKLRNFAYFRGDLSIKVVISGSPFHYGNVLLSYQPFVEFNTALAAILTNGFTKNTLNYLSQARGSTIMSYRDNQPVEMVCPYISTKPMHRLFNKGTAIAISAATAFDDFLYAGDLFIQGINPVAAASATASDIYIQVYAWVENAQLGTNTATQIAITTESGELDEREIGPVERVASWAYTISNALTAVPFMAPYAKASSIGAGALASIAAIFGWSKPTMNSEPVYTIPYPYSNSAQTIGYDATLRITLDPKQELGIGSECVAVPDDEMVISHIAARCTYLDTITWASTDTPMGSSIWNSLVTPSLCTTEIGVKNYVQPSAMAFAVAPFTYWRGDIIFRFEIVCSQYHRGKIAIYYEPNISQYALINTALSLNKQYIRVIDIQDTNVFELRVNWAAVRPWLLVQSAAAAPYNTVTPSLNTEKEGYANGYIGVVPFTALQSPDGSDVSINIYTYSDNLHVNGLSSRNIPSERITTESGELCCIGSEEISTVDLNVSTASTAHICEDYFGEQPVSFRGLMKRYVSTTRKNGTAVAAGSQVLKVVAPIFPVTNCAPGATSFPNFELYSYLRYSYLGYKGGLKMRMVVAGVGAESTLGQTGVSLDAVTDTNVTVAITGIGTQMGPPANLEGTASFVTRTNGGITIEAPFYSSNLFNLSCTDTNDDGLSTLDLMEHNWFRNVTLLGLDNPAAGFTPGVDIQHAIGEDFSFLRFLGSTAYSVDPIV